MYKGEKTVSSRGAGKTGQPHVKKKKKKIRTFSHTILKKQKTKLKVV